MLIKNYLLSKRFFFQIFGLFYLKNYEFKKVETKVIDMGWGNAICNWEILVPSNKIYALLKVGNIIEKRELTDTSHYEYLDNSIPKKNIDYKEYVLKYFPELAISDKINEFDILTQKVKSNPKNFFIIVKKDINFLKQKKVKIIDGLHRAVILHYLNEKKIKCYIADEVVNNEE
jgi:hypothetical protein